MDSTTASLEKRIFRPYRAEGFCVSLPGVPLRSTPGYVLSVPQAEKLLCELASRQHALAVPVEELSRLLDAFGANELKIAVEEALEAGSPHPGTVRLILDRRRRDSEGRPPIPVTLPDDDRVRGLVVKTHSLAEYDSITKRED